MSECEHYQSQIDRLRHGALDRAETDLLEEHLGACAACSDFNLVAKELEDHMQGAAKAFANDIDWNRVQTQVRSLQSDYRKRLTRMACGWVGVTLALIVLAGSPLDFWAVALRSGLIAAVIVMACFEVGPLYAWFRYKEASNTDAAPGELLTVLRRELDRRMGRIRTGRALSTTLAAVGIAGVAWISAVLGGGADDYVWIAIVVPMGAFSILPAVVCWRQPLAQLQRERNELG